MSFSSEDFDFDDGFNVDDSDFEDSSISDPPPGEVAVEKHRIVIPIIISIILIIVAAIIMSAYANRKNDKLVSNTEITQKIVENTIEYTSNDIEVYLKESEYEEITIDEQAFDSFNEYEADFTVVEIKYYIKENSSGNYQVISRVVGNVSGQVDKVEITVPYGAAKNLSVGTAFGVKVGVYKVQNREFLDIKYF